MMDGCNADITLYTGEMAHYWSLLNTWVSRVTLKLHWLFGRLKLIIYLTYLPYVRVIFQ